MVNSVLANLKYANLQMASESLFGVNSTDTVGATKHGEALTSAELVIGNRRASRFTVTQADQFVSDWEVVEHKSDTATGFSGTLFKCLVDDPLRGLTRGELVLSFRSTEFVDDNVRDSKATNELEIQSYGWAFGQLDDMETWYKSLKSSGLIDRPISVTGYSLGGHLATAFALLRQEEGRSADISSTYTFNGAGVGALKSEVRLTDVLQRFDLSEII